jgi:hypothetical protein
MLIFLSFLKLAFDRYRSDQVRRKWDELLLVINNVATTSGSMWSQLQHQANAPGVPVAPIQTSHLVRRGVGETDG